MKRILFIAQQAYPVRSSEAICNSKVAFSLAEAGYLVDVFTYRYNSTYPIDNRIDSVLRNSYGLTIHEIEEKNHNCILSRSFSLWTNLKNFGRMLIMWRKTGYFYNGMSDAYDILCAIKNHLISLDSFPYDVVITRAYSSELAAIYLKETYGVKWIANWNDPYPICRFPAPYGNGPKAKIQLGYKRVYNKVLKLVDFHSFPSERLREYMLRSFQSVDRSHTAVIPHMAHSKLQYHVEKHDSCLKLVSCGSVQSPRNPSLFIKALRNVINVMGLTPQDIHCYFVGKFDSALAQTINDSHLDEYVSLTGPKQYAECLDFIASCDLSLIIEAVCEEGIYLPTKFADAVQSGVPVFCVSPQPGTLKDLVEKFHNGYYSDNTSIDSIETALKQAVLDFKMGHLPKVSQDEMHCFFEKDIIDKYASVFNEIQRFYS